MQLGEGLGEKPKMTSEAPPQGDTTRPAKARAIGVRRRKRCSQHGRRQHHADDRDARRRLEGDADRHFASRSAFPPRSSAVGVAADSGPESALSQQGAAKARAGPSPGCGLPRPMNAEPRPCRCRASSSPKSRERPTGDAPRRGQGDDARPPDRHLRAATERGELRRKCPARAAKLFSPLSPIIAGRH